MMNLMENLCDINISCEILFGNLDFFLVLMKINGLR